MRLLPPVSVVTDVRRRVEGGEALALGAWRSRGAPAFKWIKKIQTLTDVLEDARDRRLEP